MQLNNFFYRLKNRLALIVAVSVFVFWSNQVLAQTAQSQQAVANSANTENTTSTTNNTNSTSANLAEKPLSAIRVSENSENSKNSEKKALSAIHFSENNNAEKTQNAQGAENTKQEAKKQERKESSLALLAGNLTKVLLALGFVIFLMYIAYYLTRKLKIGTVAPNSIKVLQVYQLGTKEKLMLVEVADKCLFLGVTPNQINALTEVDINLVKENSQNQAEKVAFSDILHKFRKDSEKTKKDQKDKQD